MDRLAGLKNYILNNRYVMHYFKKNNIAYPKVLQEESFANEE